MQGPRTLLAIGAVAVVPLAVSLGVTMPGPHPLATQVRAGQVLLVDDPRLPGGLPLQDGPQSAPVVVSARPAAPLGAAAEAALGVTGLLVLAGATVTACTGGTRVRTA